MGKKRGILFAALVLVALVILVWFLAAKPGHGNPNASIDSNASEESQTTATNEGPTTDNEPVVSVSTQAQQGAVSALSAPTNQMAAVALVATATNDAASTTAVLTASTGTKLESLSNKGYVLTCGPEGAVNSSGSGGFRAGGTGKSAGCGCDSDTVRLRYLPHLITPAEIMKRIRKLGYGASAFEEDTRRAGASGRRQSEA